MRFWGKLLCKNHDIYVIEAESSEKDVYENVPGEEPRGKGINTNSYWIAHDLIGEWCKLPDLKGKTIITARRIKKMLSGNLDGQVSSYPIFPEPEQFLIRAQIARITHGTVIAPTHVFKLKDENSINQYYLF